MEARALLKLKTDKEFSPQGRAQSNPAERAVQTVRRLGNTLLENLRKGTGLDIPSSHPCYVWSYAHAAWLYNRYHVTADGTTPFEASTSRPYVGRLAPFGACIYGQPLPVPKNTRRGTPTWRKGIYVGKLMDSDLSFALSPEGLFVTRAVRRCAKEWQPEFLMECKGLPWDDSSARRFGVASKTLRRRGRPALAAAGLPEEIQDEETHMVEAYARKRAEEALARPFGLLMDSDEDYVPTEREEEVPETPGRDLQPELPRQPVQEVQPRLYQGVPQPDLQQGEPSDIVEEEMKEIAKEIAKSSGVPHEEEPPSKVAKKEFEEHPSKVPRRGEPTSPTRSALSSTPHFAGGIQTICLDGEEEVEVDEVPLEHPDDWGDFEEENIEEESEDAGPPHLCPEELQELEKEADETELNRLLEMEVLIPADPNNLDGYRFLTTKSVYDWRWRMLEEKGKFGWKRRSSWSRLQVHEPGDGEPL